MSGREPGIQPVALYVTKDGILDGDGWCLDQLV